MKRKFRILLLILLTVVFWRLVGGGLRVSSDFPFISQPQYISSFDLPRVWTEGGAEGLGEYVAFFLWSYPINFIGSFFAKLGLEFVFLEWLLVLMPILLMGVFGMWKFSQSLGFSREAKLIATSFYLINTYIILLIDGGQLLLGLAYAFFPLSFLVFDNGVNGGLRNKIVAGLVLTILGFFDFRFIFVLFLLLFLRFLYGFLFPKERTGSFLNERKKRVDWIGKWFFTTFICGLVVLGLNAYWLLPLKFAPITSLTHAFFTQTTFLSFTNLGHSIMLLSPHWYENIFGSVTALKWEFLLIPILVFAAPILRKKSPLVGFWLLVALISVFLSKGSSGPLSNLYPWMFENIPGFSLFRDSTKFFVLVALSYSVLIGVTVDEVIVRLRNYKSQITNYKLFLLLVICYLLFLIRPVLQDKMTGILSKPRFEKEYTFLADLLDDDNNFSRVFWIPSFPALGYSEPIHPRVEAARLVQKRTFAAGTKGTYEIFNFLREAPYMGEIFNVAGIGYIAYPPLDEKKDNMHPDNIRYYFTFLDQLSKLPWLSKIDHPPIPLLKVKNHQERFFLTPNLWWVIGSDNIYNESTKSANLSLSKNAFVFAEEYAGLGSRISELPEAKIILNDKTVTDLAAGFILPDKLLFPAKNLKNDPDENGWWKREAKDIIAWRYFLADKYGIETQDFDLGGGWAVGEGEKEFQMSNVKFQMGNILLARVMESSRSGLLKFYQDEKEVGQIKTQMDSNANIRWFEVGKLIDDREITIKSQGDINVVNTLASLDKDLWESYKNRADKLQEKIAVLSKDNTSTASATISYTKINPTKYRVSVSNLKKSGFLIFSQSYDGFWKVNGQSGFPVYSLLNGFRVEKDGQYLVEFEVQKYVIFGLVISGITLLLAGGAIKRNG